MGKDRSVPVFAFRRSHQHHPGEIRLSTQEDEHLLLGKPALQQNRRRRIPFRPENRRHDFLVDIDDAPQKFPLSNPIALLARQIRRNDREIKSRDILNKRLPGTVINDAPRSGNREHPKTVALRHTLILLPLHRVQNENPPCQYGKNKKGQPPYAPKPPLGQRPFEACRILFSDGQYGIIDLATAPGRMDYVAYEKFHGSEYSFHRKPCFLPQGPNHRFEPPEYRQQNGE